MSLIPFVKPEETTREVEEVYQKTRRSFAALGPMAESFIPNSAKILAHHPPIFKTYIDFVQATLGPGLLNPRLKHLAVLRTTLTNGCNY
jgi:hypothetical protein